MERMVSSIYCHIFRFNSTPKHNLPIPWQLLPAFNSPMPMKITALEMVLLWQLYYFPVAVVTTNQRLGGLKQRKSILSHFWVPEAKIKVMCLLEGKPFLLSQHPVPKLFLSLWLHNSSICLYLQMTFSSPWFKSL